MTVKNVGLGAAAGATLTDAIPDGAVFAAGSLATQGSPAATFDGSAVTWAGTVAPGQTVVVGYAVTVTATDGYVNNKAILSHPSLPQPVQANASSQVFGGFDRIFTNETDHPIPDDESASQVESTIDVAESFTVKGVTVGVTLDHPYRGDISATLSPDGSVIPLIAADGENLNKNYDVLLDGASTNPLNDESDDDTAMPFYDRTVAPAASLAGLVGRNPAGAWTLTVCDDAPATTARCGAGRSSSAPPRPSPRATRSTCPRSGGNAPAAPSGQGPPRRLCPDQAAPGLLCPPAQGCAALIRPCNSPRR